MPTALHPSAGACIPSISSHCGLGNQQAHGWGLLFNVCHSFSFPLGRYLGDGRFHLESIMIANPGIPAYRYAQPMGTTLVPIVRSIPVSSACQEPVLPTIHATSTPNLRAELQAGAQAGEG